MEQIRLEQCDQEDRASYGGAPIIRYTDPDTGAWVQLVYDEDCANPLEDQEGIEIAFRARDQYVGTADAIPDDLRLACKHCDGYGEEPGLYDLVLRAGYFDRKLVGRGSYQALAPERDRSNNKPVDGTVYVLEGTECVVCHGEREVEADSIEEYVKRDREARAAYTFGTGNYREATAVIYVTDDDWTDPEATVKAWADEYRSWAEGDCYGIQSGDSRGESDDSCWGFIGRDNAEEEAVIFLRDRIEEVKERREANVVRGTN